MENNSQPKVGKISKKLKIGLWVAVFALFSLTVYLGGGWYLQKKFPAQLKSLVYEKSHGQYQLEFDKLTLSLLKGNLFLENVRLRADTQAYKVNAKEDAGKYLIEAMIQQVRFSGINIFRYIRKKELSMRSILIERPDLVLYQMKDTEKKDTVEKSMYDQVPAFLKGAKLGSLDVHELSFAKHKIGHLNERVDHLAGLTFSISDVDLNASALDDVKRTWFSKDIQINSKQLTYALADGMYVLKAEKLLLSTKERTVEVEAFKVIPQYKEMDFFQKLGHAGSRYNMIIPQLRVEDFDFKKLETEGKIVAQSLSIGNGQILIFSDKRMPGRKDNAIRNAPHLALQRLKIPVFLDSLKVENVELHYREFNPKSNKIGDVFFTQMGGTMTNITNDSIALAKNHWATSHFNMNFLDQAKIQVDLNLNLISKDGEFTYKGSLGPANALVYNSILEPLAMVKVDQGHFNKISFDVKANQRGSYGTVQALYKDLKVSLLVKDDRGRIGREGLFSFLANSFLLTTNNPEEGLPARLSHFTYTHVPTRSFFNLMWKGIFEGIKENVIETKAQKHEKKKILKERKREAKKEEKRRKKLASS